ncbi:helix-turn-helix transcriptional regulator [Emticicia fontis]
MHNSLDSSQELDGFMRLEQILKLIPVSKATWWNGCKSGRFPKSYKICPRVTAWKMSDIKNCLDSFEQTRK